MARTVTWAAAMAVAIIVGLGGCAASQPAWRPTLAETTISNHPTAYFFGDSWSAGYLTSPRLGFPEVTAELLGWTPTVNAVVGTGYVHVYDPKTSVYSIRADAIPPGQTADVVILQGGLNDDVVGLEKFPAAARKTMKIFKLKFPDAAIVVVGPETPGFPARPAIYTVDRYLRAAAKAEGLHYISPLAQHWFTKRNIAIMIDRKTYHPTTAGQAYFGGRLAVALQRLGAR